MKRSQHRFKSHRSHVGNSLSRFRLFVRRNLRKVDTNGRRASTNLSLLTLALRSTCRPFARIRI